MILDNALNTACPRLAGLCGVFKHFPQPGETLLQSRAHTHLAARFERHFQPFSIGLEGAPGFSPKSLS